MSHNHAALIAIAALNVTGSLIVMAGALINYRAAKIIRNLLEKDEDRRED
jgi:hypothetical protein